MNNVMHTRTIEPVRISVQESADGFAGQDSEIQAAWLIHLASSIDGWEGINQSWPMQCRYITDEMSLKQRRHVASMLETLVEHLNDTPATNDEPVKVVMLDADDRIAPGMYEVTMIEESSVSDCCGIVLKPVKVAEHSPAFLEGYEAYFQTPPAERKYENPYSRLMSKDFHDWERGWSKALADYTADLELAAELAEDDPAQK